MKRTILFNFMKKKLSIREERQNHYVSHISIWHISFLKRIRQSTDRLSSAMSSYLLMASPPTYSVFRGRVLGQEKWFRGPLVKIASARCMSLSLCSYPSAAPSLFKGNNDNSFEYSTTNYYQYYDNFFSTIELMRFMYYAQCLAFESFDFSLYVILQY